MAAEINLEEMLEDTVLLQCRVNGRLHESEIEATTSLLDYLREELVLTGTHMGCKTGHCGACTVMIDGQAVKSCITPAVSVQRAKITTIEGLAAPSGELNTVQQAFWDEAGFQCGYCGPGMLFAVTELLAENPKPSDDEIRVAIAGNLCRCTGYQSIVRAAQTAAERLRESRDDA